MKKILLSILLLFVNHFTFADIIGVEDAQMLIVAYKQLEELRQAYRLLANTYQTSKSQLDELKQLKSVNSGHYGVGNLNNGLDVLQSWQSPASTWQDALQNLSGGNQSRYQALLEAYEKNHPTLDERPFVNPLSANRFKEDKAVNRAVLVQTSESYNEINKRMQALHDLSQQIEKTNTTKASVDLNARLITELAFIQLMSLRLQTLMNHQVAQDSLAELQDRSEMAEFNRGMK